MDYFSQSSTILKNCVLPFLLLLVPAWSDSVRELNQIPTAFQFSKEVKGYLLMDAQSGQVIQASEDSRAHLAPASLTKMMTIYLVVQALNKEQLRLTDKVVVSPRASVMEGSRMFIAPHSSVRVQDLIQGVIVHSGNDASIALAEHLAVSEKRFVAEMNEKANKLGMLDTHFENATGLPQPNHYTTPLDMAKLARAIILDFPEYYPWCSQKSFTYSNIQQVNRNRLLWLDPSVDGIKTGETTEAGYCLAASAIRENMRLIAIVMGATSKKERIEVAKTLLDDGFRLFETKKYCERDKIITQSRVWCGKHFKVKVGLANDLYITLPRGCTQPIREQIFFKNALIAPLAEKELVGELRLLRENECLSKVSLVALEAVQKGSWLNQRLSRWVLFWLRNRH